MKIIRHTARDMRQALRAVREQLGEDAVILSSRRTGEGVEVTAAVDFDATTLEAGGFTNAGTIFVLNTNGSGYRPIFQFGRGTNAAKVPNGLIEGSDGFLYGTTQSGGSNNFGVAFRIGKDGTNYGILKTFGADARTPGKLIEGVDGWLYGLSFSGGTSGRGTVFKLQKDGGNFTVLRNLGAGSEGYFPLGGLVQTADGSLFGTTTSGGISNVGNVFRISPDGSDYRRLHDFVGGEDGQRPQASLMADANGTLFGTTASTGRGIAGTVFRIDSDGSNYRVLHGFPDTAIEARAPKSVLTSAGDVLYGTTSAGGSKGKGTLFRIKKDGSDFATLWNFPELALDGETPTPGLTAAGDGSYLGVTEAGGQYGNGTVFRIDPVPVRLRIGFSGLIELSWPQSSTTDRLDVTDQLTLPDWKPLPNEVQAEGSLFKVNVSPESSARFFRLHRQWE